MDCFNDMQKVVIDPACSKVIFKLAEYTEKLKFRLRMN